MLSSWLPAGCYCCKSVLLPDSVWSLMPLTDAVKLLACNLQMLHWVSAAIHPLRTASSALVAGHQADVLHCICR